MIDVLTTQLNVFQPQATSLQSPVRDRPPATIQHEKQFAQRRLTTFCCFLRQETCDVVEEMKIYGSLLLGITILISFVSPSHSSCTWRPFVQWFMSDFPTQTAFWILNHSTTCLPSRPFSFLSWHPPSSWLKNCKANFFELMPGRAMEDENKL